MGSWFNMGKDETNTYVCLSLYAEHPDDKVGQAISKASEYGNARHAVLTVPVKPSYMPGWGVNATSWYVMPLLKGEDATFAEFDTLECVMFETPSDVAESVHKANGTWRGKAAVLTKDPRMVLLSALLSHGRAHCPDAKIANFDDADRTTITFELQGKVVPVSQPNSAVDVTQNNNFLLIAYPLLMTQLDNKLNWLSWAPVPQDAVGKVEYWTGSFTADGRTRHFFSRSQKPNQNSPLYEALQNGSARTAGSVSSKIAKMGPTWTQAVVDLGAAPRNRLCFMSPNGTVVRFFEQVAGSTVSAARTRVYNINKPSEADLQEEEDAQEKACGKVAIVEALAAGEVQSVASRMTFGQLEAVLIDTDRALQSFPDDIMRHIAISLLPEDLRQALSGLPPDLAQHALLAVVKDEIEPPQEAVSLPRYKTLIAADRKKAVRELVRLQVDSEVTSEASGVQRFNKWLAEAAEVKRDKYNAAVSDIMLDLLTQRGGQRQT